MATVASAKTYVIAKNVTRQTVATAKTYAILKQTTDVVASFPVSWGIINEVSASFPVAWSVVAADVSASFLVEWAIEAASEISASFAVLWAIEAADVTKSYNVAWSLLSDPVTSITKRGIAELNTITAAYARNAPNSSTQVGDLLIAFIQSRFYPPTSIPAGWELIDYQVCDSDGFLQYLQAYKKVMEASDLGVSHQWNYSTSGRTDCLFVPYYDTNGAPISVEGVLKSVVNTQAVKTINGPQITTASNNARGVVGYTSVYASTTQTTSTAGVSQLIPGSSSNRRVTAGDAVMSPGVPLVNSATWAGSANSDEAFAAIGFVLTAEPIAQQTFPVSWAVLGPVEKSYVVDWSNEGVSAEASFVIEWEFDAAPAEAAFTVAWSVVADVVKAYAIKRAVEAVNFIEPERVIIPDFPITETWTWRTSVFRSYSGNEERRSYSPSPVITQQFSALSLAPEDFQQLRAILEVSPEAAFAVPLFQYYDVTRELTPQGSSRLYFSPSRLNLSVGQEIMIVPNENDNRDAAVHTVTELFSDGCEIDPPLGADLDFSYTISPVVSCRLSSNASTDNAPAYNRTSFSFVSLTRGRNFVRDGNTQTLPTIDGDPLLLRRISDDGAQDTYNSGLTVIDNALAPPVIFKTDIPRKSFEVSFRARRELSSDDFDYWRKFFDTVRGQWRAFCIPTWRDDGTITISGSTVTVYGTTFYSIYSVGGYTGLLLRRGANVYEAVQVTGVAVVDGNSICYLSAAPSSEDYDYASFILRARLADDQVVVTHNETDSVISISCEMVKR